MRANLKFVLVFALLYIHNWSDASDTECYCSLALKLYVLNTTMFLITLHTHTLGRNIRTCTLANSRCSFDAVSKHCIRVPPARTPNAHTRTCQTTAAALSLARSPSLLHTSNKQGCECVHLMLGYAGIRE